MNQKLKEVFKCKVVNKAPTINTGLDEFPRWHFSPRPPPRYETRKPFASGGETDMNEGSRASSVGAARSGWFWMDR